MSTLYKRGPVYYVGVPTRSGGWVKKSTGTHVRAQAIRIQAMLRDLGPTGQRAWDFLDAIRDGNRLLAHFSTRIRSARAAWTNCASK